MTRNVTERCRANHTGLWLVHPDWANSFLATLRSEAAELAALDPPPLGVITRAGTAIIPIAGMTMKGDSKFGGTNTLRVREALRTARENNSVGRGVLLIDSPGGAVAGTTETVDEIRRFAAVKPITAYLDDLGTSAAYWMASATNRISAHRSTEVGSIGVLAVVHDTSKAADLSGVVVHAIASGPRKGSFVGGVPIEPESLAALQDRVDELFGLFLKDVMIGRGLDRKAAEAVADGRTFLAGDAKKMGLIDAVESFDDHLARVEGTPRLDRAKRAARILPLT